MKEKVYDCCVAAAQAVLAATVREYRTRGEREKERERRRTKTVRAGRERIGAHSRFILCRQSGRWDGFGVDARQ